MTTFQPEVGDQRELERINSVAENAYQYMDRNALTTFTRNGRKITFEPDFATLTIVDIESGQLRLNAVRDSDGWQDLGSNISPDMVAEMQRLNHPMEVAPLERLERQLKSER